MAINVDDVYKTVLYIINKEQRGYLTPEEFNKIATQVQLETFEKYFEDLNQQLRIPENDSEYGNRVKNVEEKLDIFKVYSDNLTLDNTDPARPFFLLPSDLYDLGTVMYNEEIEVQRIQRNEFLLINKSPLTKPTTDKPVYIQEGTFLDLAATPDPVLYKKIFVFPITSNQYINCSYVKKPSDVRWGYAPNSITGAYIYNPNIYDSLTSPTGSTDFELHESEQSEVVLNILLYAGVVIRDPQIIQTAAQKIQQDEVNEKS